MCTQSLRDAVALVPQETMLFNDSIMQNIRCAQSGGISTWHLTSPGLPSLHAHAPRRGLAAAGARSCGGATRSSVGEGVR